MSLPNQLPYIWSKSQTDMDSVLLSDSAVSPFLPPLTDLPAGHRRATWSDVELPCLSGQSAVPGTQGLVYPIPYLGDLLHSLTLRFRVEPTYVFVQGSGTTVYAIDNSATNLARIRTGKHQLVAGLHRFAKHRWVPQAELLLGTKPVEKLTTDVAVLNEVLSDDRDRTLLPNPTGGNFYTYYRLPFTFSQKATDYLPLLLLGSHQAELRLELGGTTAALSDALNVHGATLATIAEDGTITGGALVTAATLQGTFAVKEVKLLARYVFADNTDRSLLYDAYLKGQYQRLLPEHTIQQFEIPSGTSGVKRHALRFRGPCSALWVYYRPNSETDHWMLRSDPLLPIFKTMTLSLNNQELIKPAQPPEYFRDHTQLLHYEGLLPAEDGLDVFVVPFALRQPLDHSEGEIDLSSFQQADLVLDWNTTLSPGTLYVVQKGWNVLRIQDGMASLRNAR